MTNVLVAYFSAGGVTKKTAQKLQKVLGADIYEIKPEVPYTDADLNWMDKSSRTTLEMEDKTSRPAIVMDGLDTAKYDTVFLGFPIWWYIAPTIVNTFLEAYDFSDKKVVIFATSGGSGFGKTVEFLKPSIPNSEIIQWKILNHNPSEIDLKNWVEELNI